MTYIFDIDGTVADISHRLHFIEGKPQDWRAFFAACSDDQPIWEVIKVANALWMIGHAIVFISGRRDEVAEKTRSWLDKYGLRTVALYMRREGDHRQDNIVKSELLDAFLKDNPGADIGGVFEDRKQAVEMYRTRGLRVFQVADGDF